jgi:hypothetical protein
MRELRFRRYVWARFGGFVVAGGVWVEVGRYLAEIERDRGVQLSWGDVSALLTQETLTGGSSTSSRRGLPGGNAHPSDI